MKNYYILAIPVVIGIIAGLYLYNLSSESQTTDEIKLTPSTLIENGSPILGDESAPITIVEWGDYQCT
ncbi:MAG: disulfide bond formation protein DsbA, partial [Nitrosopumilaceae archaeon]|nr:disulfide bond formation protein DsbA [Nitrosopumilaceae archaeon]